MLDLLASLVAGPAWRRSPGAARVGWRTLACVPLLVLCAGMLATAVAGAMWAPPSGRAVGLAAVATLAGLVLALPVVVAGVSEVWLVPLVAGAAGWALLPLPAGAFSDAARMCVLGLPVMVYALGVAWRRMTPAQMLTAALAGAGPLARGRMFALAVAPGVVVGCAVVFVVCLGAGRGPF